MAKTGISRLLIASAIDPDIYRRFLESPEATFDEFGLADDDRELLRHPDHRLLGALAAALAEENATAAVASVATVAAPSAAAVTPPASAPLPDMSLVLTVVPCALYDEGKLHSFNYVAWVSPLPAGADPETLPPPAGTVFPGKPLPPLHAVVRVSAIQMQDVVGNPLVGLSASLVKDTNMSAPPPREAAGNPAAMGRDLSTAEVQSAVAAVRSAPAEGRYAKLIELLRVLHPEGSS